ncbi:LacI family transcriptional regulator [Verrucomicrobia bacterium LW23]|nr:LacI family transcriptional regulator [Verrucomicrobia bacterium LW23]
MPSNRVTLRAVAAAAGVHFSTASLALSDSPKLPKATRERIQAIATELGYKQDAALAALNAYRKVKQNATFQATLAIVTNHPKPDGWRVYVTGAESYTGMQSQASKLGYNLEEFSVANGETDFRVLNRTLTARNISGIIAVPMLQPHARIELDWHKFSAIALGFSMDYPSLHRVASAHLRNTERCMNHLYKLGYRRVGLAMLRQVHERVARLHGAGYDTTIRLYPEMARIPFFTPSDYDREYTPEALASWIRRYRIDAVMTSHQGDLLNFLPKAGIRIPEDIGVINLAAAGTGIAETGIHESNEQIGRTAINLLVGMLHRDERGVPRTPIQTLVDGDWVEGNTLREQVAASKKAKAKGENVDVK